MVWNALIGCKLQVEKGDDAHEYRSIGNSEGIAKLWRVD